MTARAVPNPIVYTVAKRALFVLGLVSSATLAAAQPPPVGPPVNVTNAGSLPIPLITNEVRNRAQQRVDETNAQLAAEGSSYTTSISELQVWGPLRTASTLWDRPNSSFVLIPHILSIEVHIPWASNRFIHIPLDITVSCDGWDTAAGTITVRSKAGPASIEGGNIFEDILHIRSVIDARVRAAFNSPAPITVPLDFLPACYTIGASKMGTTAVDDDLILWDVPRPPRPWDPIRLNATVEVTFDRLTRLPAQTIDGDTLYQDVETFYLNLFANYSSRQRSLTMQEGDVVSLSDVPPVTLVASKYDKLVVIANAEQPPNNPRDSGYGVGLRTQSYSPGAHSIVIPKWYWRPPDQFIRKPTLVSVPAYRLDYTVRYIDPTIVVGF
jgi:hypothetical protein